jgi:mRNA interferase RelE/StbE
MAYHIHLHSTAKRQLANLPAEVQKKISPAIDMLAANPRPPGIKKLKGMDAWRIRVGDYRIIYEIRDNVALVLVIKIAHRSEAYK